MRVLRDNGLSVFFLLLVVASIAGQALVGHAGFNHDQVAHQGIRSRSGPTSPPRPSPLM